MFTGTNTLIILDNCAVSQDLKKCSNKFIDLAFSGRHYGLSLWVLTQQLTSIAKPFRDNVASVISFYFPNEKSMKILFEEHDGNIYIDTKNNMLKISKSLPHPYQCYLEIPSSIIKE